LGEQVLAKERLAKKKQRRKGMTATATDDFPRSAYVNPNDTYVQTENVMNGHKLSGTTFLAGGIMPYVQAVLTKPAVLFVLAILSLIGLNIGLLIRCKCCQFCKCCVLCRCLPKPKGANKIEMELSLHHQKMGITAIFAFLCLAVFVTDFLCYYGYNYIDEGVNALLHTVDLINIIFTKVAKYTSNMYNVQATLLTTSLNAAEGSCTGAGAYDLLHALQPSSEAFSSATKTLHNIVSPVPDLLTGAKGTINQYAVDDRYTHKHIYIYIYIIYIYTCIHTHIHTLINAYIDEHTHTHTHIHNHIHLNTP